MKDFSGADLRQSFRMGGSHRIGGPENAGQVAGICGDFSMLKHLIMPLAAALILVSIAPANAVLVRVPGGAPSTGSAGAPSTGEVDSPGDPFYPGSVNQSSNDDPTDDDTPKFLKPQKKAPVVDATVTGSVGGSRSDCGSDLGSLRKVTASAVRSVGLGDNIDIIPLCVGRSVSSTQFRVEQLRAPISQNDTLTAALRMKGYDSSQVVGVVIADDLVVLYVH